MRFQVEGIFQGKAIRPRVIEGSSADAVRRSAEARGLREVVVYPADDPFASDGLGVAWDEERSDRRGSTFRGLIRLAVAAVGIWFLFSIGRSLSRLPQEVAARQQQAPAVAPQEPQPAAFPRGRSEAKFGPIFAKINEGSERAYRLTRLRYGEDYSRPPGDTEAKEAWSRDRGQYLDEQVFQQYLALSKETGLTVFDLLDIRDEGAARGWHVGPEKRKGLTTEVMQKRYRDNKEISVGMSVMFNEKLKRTPQ